MKRNQLTFKENVIFYSIIFVAFVSFFFAIIKLTNYEGRMQEYNRHMCVDVYGLNEECK